MVEVGGNGGGLVELVVVPAVVVAWWHGHRRSCYRDLGDPGPP